MANQNAGSQMRVTDDEMNILKASFAGNEKLLKLLRKMFLPELDASVPIGQQIDLWMTVNVTDMSPEDAKINLLARNQLIQHVEQTLMQMKILAGSTDETAEETKDRLAKDSSK